MHGDLIESHVTIISNTVQIISRYFICVQIRIRFWTKQTFEPIAFWGWNYIMKTCTETYASYVQSNRIKWNFTLYTYFTYAYKHKVCWRENKSMANSCPYSICQNFQWTYYSHDEKIFIIDSSAKNSLISPYA